MGETKNTEKDTAKDTAIETRTIEQIRETFSQDHFATDVAGASVIEARPQYARCEMELKPFHLNARGAVMGGAIFTLADFAVAVASNAYKENPDTVTIHAGINFLSPAKGKVLTAEATCVKSGRTTCLYEVIITDELGTLVAQSMVNGFTVRK